MGSFEFIEHTADKGFHVKGENLEDLFVTSVKGLAKLLREDLSPDIDQLPEQHRLEITALDETALLVDFLSEILTRSHIGKTVFVRSEIEEINSQKVQAHIYGIPIDYFDEEIKAVTFHQADIQKNESGLLETNIIVDI